MTTLTGGEVVLRCLAPEGVKHIIGITDEGYHTIQHHCREYGIRFVAPRHEAAGAHLAQGIYKSSGEDSAGCRGLRRGVHRSRGIASRYAEEKAGEKA